MTTIYNINELKNLPDGSSVKVCGIITKTRRIPPVKDPTKFIAAGNIEDSTGEIEFIALHKILKKYNSLLEPENKVIITGKYKKSADNSSFIDVESVMPYKKSILKNCITEIKIKKTNNETIYTGFTDLDKLTDGFKGGELILISGCPSMGKTSFVSNLVLNIGANTEKRLAAFLPKMSHIQFLKRIIGISLGVDFHKIKSNCIAKENCKKTQKQRVRLSICLDDTKNINNNYIEGKSVFWLIKHDRLDLVIINDLNHLKCDEPVVNRKEKICQILTGLKNLAVELNIPVVVISQLPKSIEKRKDKHPLITDLRADSLRALPDKILFIYRDSKYCESCSEKTETAEIIVAKNNTGKTGTVNLLYDKEKHSFKNLEIKDPVTNKKRTISSTIDGYDMSERDKNDKQ